MKPWEEGNRRMNIYIKSFDSENETQLTHETDRGIYGYFWLSDSRIAYVKDKKCEEVFDEIIKNQLQKPLSLKLKKIYPLSLCEIRILEIEK